MPEAKTKFQWMTAIKYASAVVGLVVTIAGAWKMFSGTITESTSIISEQILRSEREIAKILYGDMSIRLIIVNSRIRAYKDTPVPDPLLQERDALQQQLDRIQKKWPGL